MKQETFKASVASAWGKELPAEVKFSYNVDLYENIAEVPAKERLTPDEELVAINNKAKASERAKATIKALEAAGHTKPDPKSPEVVKENMIKLIMVQQSCDRAKAEKIYQFTVDAAANL